MKGRRIGSLEFKSITACYEYARKIINSEIGKFEANHPTYNFLIDLLENHPEKNEKIGCGVNYFIIEPNRLNPTGNGVYIIRNDGSCIDFSWRLCCGKNKNASTYNYNLTFAMRNAVKEYTIGYKQSHELKCEVCLITNLEYSQYHVDHKTTPFSLIVEQFLQVNKCNNISFNDCYLSHSAEFKQDEPIKNKWIEYHNQVADYQILCASCNSSKGTK
jgi:hypothetical protein